MKLFLFLISCVIARADIVAASFPTEPPANQLRVFDNSCGPVALYNSLHYGSGPWKELLGQLEAEEAREKIRSIVRIYGSRPSYAGNGARRWHGRHGINAQDLTAVGNDLRNGRRLPALELATYFQGPKVENTRLLKNLYKDLKSSLKRGFPAIATLQRYRTRKTRQGRVFWGIAQSHFVSIIAIPDKLERNARTFDVTYIDPWGGTVLKGAIQAPPSRFPTGVKGNAAFDPSQAPAAPRALFPGTRVGLRDIPKGQQSVLILSGLILPK